MSVLFLLHYSRELSVGASGDHAGMVEDMVIDNHPVADSIMDGTTKQVSKQKIVSIESYHILC